MVSKMPALKKKVWKFPELEAPSEELLAVAGGSEILAALMQRRGIASPEQAASFLDPSKYQPTSPMVFADMGKAIARISQAIAQKEKITVYGDYDVDGVTATSVMLTTLKQLGANVDFYIPNRATEGYGLNLKAVSILASKQRTKLIITCDCGISNFAEINLAKSLGVETIIVDHHSMPEVLPPAVAILHPKQLAEEHPLFHLPGVGVAYKLAEALYLDNELEAEIPKLHDFVTLGMIADMVPLVQENRYLVQIGLPALVNSPRAGIRALLDNTVKMDGTDIVGFGLAPRINAVGRLADASLAVNLMTVEDEAKAQELANQLEMENARRQELCEQIFFEADLKAKHALASGEDHALALYSETWHHGVVGIVASRLVEKYHCPVFVAELDKEEGKIKGSARGVAGIDLYQILKANEHLMTKWGGHQMAAGFSAEASQADLLCRSLVDTCNRALTGVSKRPVLEIDLALAPDDVDLSLARLVRKLGPFGMWNKKPVLVMQSLTVLSCRSLGKDGKHHKLMLRSADGVNQFECVYWRSGSVPNDGSLIDLAFSPEVNVFNNNERLQLVLADWRQTGEIEEAEDAEIIDFTPPVESRANKNDLGSVTASAESKSGSSQAAAPRVVHLETEYDGQRALTVVRASSESANSTPRQSPAANVGEGLINMEPEYADEDIAGLMQGGDEAETSEPESAEEAASARAANPARIGATQITLKDLREHSNPKSVVDAAVRKLGSQVAVFGENCKLDGHTVLDRSLLAQSQHLLIWQFPPSMQVLRSLITKAAASQIYFLGGAGVEGVDTAAFLKRLLAMIRFAVNQRDGQAPAEKLCAGLGTTKMALALGLTLLKKAEMIDWYAEDSIIYLEVLPNSEAELESIPEYRQLSNTLKEITEFRNWCAEAPFEEIQSELVPNSIRLAGQIREASQEGAKRDDGNSRSTSNGRTSYAPGEPREV